MKGITREIVEISQEELKRVVSYDPDTGEFRWLKSGKPGLNGFIAGTKRPDGYSQICIKQELYLAHRLAWVYIHGVWPKQKIDHIDRDRGNTRIKNLREVTDSENGRNTIDNKERQSSTIRVCWNEHKNNWEILVNFGSGKRIVWSFDSEEEAIQACQNTIPTLFHKPARELTFEDLF